MIDLNLKAMGLTEMDNEEMQNTNGGFLPSPSNKPQAKQKKEEKEATEVRHRNEKH